MAYDINAMMSQVADKGKDQTKASSGGGGDYVPPAAGFVRLRFVGYFETGKHASQWQGKEKTSDQVQLVFELSGPKHPPREFDGGKEPLRMTMKETLSLSEKAWFYKTFSAMNWEGKAKHMVQLLGQDFVGEIEHVTKGEGTNAKTYANIKRGSVRKPFVANIETGEDQRVPVEAPLTAIKAFVVDFSTPEMWDSIFIGGEYPEKKDEKTGAVTRAAKSKNVIQAEIAASLNFKGMPIYDYAVGKFTKEDKVALDGAMDAVGTDPQLNTEAANDGDVGDSLAGVA